MLFELDFLLRKQNLEDVHKFIKKKNIQKGLPSARVAFFFFSLVVQLAFGVVQLQQQICRGLKLDYFPLLFFLEKIKYCGPSVRLRSIFFVKPKPNPLVKPLSSLCVVLSHKT